MYGINRLLRNIYQELDTPEMRFKCTPVRLSSPLNRRRHSQTVTIGLPYIPAIFLAVAVSFIADRVRVRGPFILVLLLGNITGMGRPEASETMIE